MSEMTLFAIPFACSMAVHLALNALALPHEVRWVHRFSAILEDGGDYRAINPKAKVPALRLPDGELLTEVASVLLHLDGLVHDRTAQERRRLLEWLLFTSTELHKPILSLNFDPRAPEATREDLRDRLLAPVLEVYERALSAQPTLLGGAPSVADAFAFWGLLLVRYQWPERVQTPGIAAFLRSTLDRPATRTVLGLEQAARQRVAA
ncbi:MAG: glutathione S-transferase N-terminal domain-containing protein [Alphaproteobacteria bacterium]|nr:glutathione S-transferase N-terminal domain-containing protein [Alphaproteobacteria bacterium]